ncbi:MAG: DoxX family protein [Saprospirales bacterium]|nr:MAG: DoxX family protein [Saprospirales bacterium]
MKDVLDLIGRIFISFIFLYDAWDSIVFYQQTKDRMTEYGLLWQQDILLSGSITLMLVGGIFLLLGYRSALAGILLLIYWLPLTFIVYAFWTIPEVDLRRVTAVMFMKNIAIAGGLLLVIVNGSGRYSLKRLIDRRRLDVKNI